MKWSSGFVYIASKSVLMTHMVDFGYFKDETIQSTLAGYVECWGDDHFVGKETMTIEVCSGRITRTDIKVVCLRCVCCKGRPSFSILQAIFGSSTYQAQ